MVCSLAPKVLPLILGVFIRSEAKKGKAMSYANFLKGRYAGRDCGYWLKPWPVLA